MDEDGKRRLVEELVNMADELWCCYRNQTVREETGVDMEDFDTDFPYATLTAVREVFGFGVSAKKVGV